MNETKFVEKKSFSVETRKILSFASNCCCLLFLFCSVEIIAFCIAQSSFLHGKNLLLLLYEVAIFTKTYCTGLSCSYFTSRT